MLKLSALDWTGGFTERCAEVSKQKYKPGNSDSEIFSVCEMNACFQSAEADGLVSTYFHLVEIEAKINRRKSKEDFVY